MEIALINTYLIICHMNTLYDWLLSHLYQIQILRSVSGIGDRIHQHPVITIYIKLGQFVDFVQTQILAWSIQCSVHRQLKSI